MTEIEITDEPSSSKQVQKSMSVVGPNCFFAETFFFFTKTPNAQVAFSFKGKSDDYDRYITNHTDDIEKLIKSENNILKIKKRDCLAENTNQLRPHALLTSTRKSLHSTIS